VPSGPATSTRIERLAALGRLWVSIRYFHPFLAYRPIDWDSALAAAIPRANAATDRESYAAAVQVLLDALGDPLTRLRSPSPPPSTAPHEPDPRTSWTRDSVLIVSLRNYQDFDDYFGTRERLSMVVDSIKRARRVVFDLRPTSPIEDPSAIDAIFTDGAIAGLFTAVPLRAPDQRGRLYSGFPPQDGTTSGGYFSGFYTVDGKLITPGDSLAGDRRAVFLADEHSQLPVDAIALHASGKARIAMVGRASDFGMVRSYAWSLPDSLEATIRLTELLRARDPVVSSADTTVLRPSERGGDAALDAALALLQRPAMHGLPAPVPWTPSAPVAQRKYARTPYPSVAEWMIAALQIWAVGQYFFPYRDLIGERWNQVLAEYLPRFEAARDSLEYALAAAEMATRLHDSHVRVSSPVLQAHFGIASPPVFVRIIEVRRHSDRGGQRGRDDGGAAWKFVDVVQRPCGQSCGRAATAARRAGSRPAGGTDDRGHPGRAGRGAGGCGGLDQAFTGVLIAVDRRRCHPERTRGILPGNGSSVADKIVVSSGPPSAIPVTARSTRHRRAGPP
jgi:hypothetical protein